jgi:hypothetical protein
MIRITKTYLPLFVLVAGMVVGAAAVATAEQASAQEAGAVVPTPTGLTREIDVPPPVGSAAEAAQHQREHERAVAAGDNANDPYNPASAADLNKQQLARAVALGNAPVPVGDPIPAPVPPLVPHPNLTDMSGDTAGSLPADPDPTMIPPEKDSSPPAADDSLKSPSPIL